MFNLLEHGGLVFFFCGTQLGLEQSNFFRDVHFTGCAIRQGIFQQARANVFQCLSFLDEDGVWELALHEVSRKKRLNSVQPGGLTKALPVFKMAAKISVPGPSPKQPSKDCQWPCNGRIPKQGGDKTGK